MADVLTAVQRKFNMSRIRGKDTKPELLIRRGLHARGLRYRLHCRSLPGSPDLVFPKYNIAVFVHGCFWHAHGCALSTLPVTRHEFWTLKLEGNVARDQKAIASLQASGWRVLVIWECAMRGRGRQNENTVLDLAVQIIQAPDIQLYEISSLRADSK